METLSYFYNIRTEIYDIILSEEERVEWGCVVSGKFRGHYTAKPDRLCFRTIQNIKEDDYELGAVDWLLPNK